MGVAIGEEITIECEVAANPEDVMFEWSFNHSIPISANALKFTSAGLRSVAKFSPIVDGDFGTLFCSAQNSIGTQQTPCAYRLVKAGMFILDLSLPPPTLPLLPVPLPLIYLFFPPEPIILQKCLLLYFLFIFLLLLLILFSQPLFPFYPNKCKNKGASNVCLIVSLVRTVQAQ